jgi:uncharacterized alkaline shock family protein YloU
MADNYITLQEEKGSINVSEDVIISLVNKVVNEIDGVAGLATTAGSELAELIGIKNVNKGTKVQIKEDSFIVDVLILVKYHYNLVDVAKKVQDAIYDGVISVTGVETAQVNVHVSGIAFEK